MPELLSSLLKAGGISGLAIGVVYLLYHEIIKLGVIPKLKQWQGFSLLCLLAVLVFIITMTILLKKTTEQLLDGELPPGNHFQMDARDGIFCEQKNVYQPSAQYFDLININIGACNGSDQYGSRSYIIEWQPSKPASVTFAKRRGYDHCFVSNLAERAPPFLQEVQVAFDRNKKAIPCKISLSMMRQIKMTYVDLRNKSWEVAFIQSYNRGETGHYEIEQASTANLARSDEMERLSQEPSGGIALGIPLEIASQYGYPEIPKQ